MAANLLGFRYGTQSDYDKIVTKNDNYIYITSDSNKIYKGSVLVGADNIKVVDALPEAVNAFSGIFYVVETDGEVTVSVLNKAKDGFITIGGVKDAVTPDGTVTLTNKTIDADNNTITNLILSNFKDGTISTTILDSASASDEKLPTEKAVATAIATGLQGYDGAFVDVTTSRASDNKGTVLTFTPKSGEPKVITIADIFLASASYDSETHTLTLVLNDESSTEVEVNLDALIGNSFSDVKVGEDETFTVELGSGGTLGGFKTGDQIAKDTSLETLIKKLLMKQVPPTYSQPSVSIANNGGTASGNYEIGTSVTPNIRATFNKADAGDLTSIQFKKGSSNVGEAQTTSPADYTEEAFVLESATTFSATATYAEGPIKNDNLGQPYPDGHIAAGSKNSSNFTMTPYRQGYFIGSTEDTAEVTSATVRGLSLKKNGAYSAGTIKLTVPVGAQRVLIACPVTNTGMTKVLNESALNADVTSTFVKSTVDVEGAAGYTAVSYNLWTFVPDVPYGQEAVLAITLG